MNWIRKATFRSALAGLNPSSQEIGQREPFLNPRPLPPLSADAFCLIADGDGESAYFSTFLLEIE